MLRPLDDDEVRAVAGRLRELGVESVAVCLLHAHRHPEHERRVGEILREELPGLPVSLSSEILREQQEYERSATTVVNAYVRPLMERYIDAIRTGLDARGLEAPLTIMQSSGGVMTADAAARRPVFALESGPAAGVVAALSLAQGLGIENAIAFDMGGTTAKASLVEAGRVSRSREYEVGASLSAGSRLLRGSGELIRIPTIDIAEVGAGGGSVAWLDAGGALHVGPRSAGAAPGPACYGNGGTEPTVTDANVVLGYIPTGRLASGDLTVDAELAAGALAPLADSLGLPAVEVARGIHGLANASMMRALRSVSSEKGRDPRDFALVAYGGSGPIHAAGARGRARRAHGDRAAARRPLLRRRAAVRPHRVPRRALLPRPRRRERARRAARARGRDARRSAAGDRQRGASGCAPPTSATRARTGTSRSTSPARRSTRRRSRLWRRGSRPSTSASTACATRRARRSRSARSGSPCSGPPRASSELRVAAQPRAAATRLADFGEAHGAIETPVVSRAEIGDQPRPGPLLIDEYDTTVVVPPGWSVRRDAAAACSR